MKIEISTMDGRTVLKLQGKMLIGEGVNTPTQLARRWEAKAALLPDVAYFVPACSAAGRTKRKPS